jgi:hypothetical protein
VRALTIRAEFVCHPSSVSIYAWSEARGIDEFK